jgi:hypothetical protein
LSYTRVSILGASPNGEVWSINPVFDPFGEVVPPTDQNALDTAADAIASLTPGTALLSLMSTSLWVTGCRLEVRDDATDALLAISTQLRNGALAGTGTPKRGATNALVISLRTTTPGASGRGRIYWPAVGEDVGSDLRFSNAIALGALGGMKTYLNAMRAALAAAWPGGAFDLSVRSKTTKSTPHVNKIQVGNVLDTQRRRRDGLVEDYQSLSFPT